MAQHRHRAGSMPVYVALCLIGACFMLGYHTQKFLQGGTHHHHGPIEDAQQKAQQQGRTLQQDVDVVEPNLPRSLRVTAGPSNTPKQPTTPSSTSVDNTPASTPDYTPASTPGGSMVGQEQEILQQAGLLRLRPPVPTGASGEPFLRSMPFQILSWTPRLLVFPAFINAVQCRIILERSKQMVLHPGIQATDTGPVLHQGDEADSIFLWLEGRIAAAALVHASHAGPFHLLHYRAGGMEHDVGAVTITDDGPQFQSARRLVTAMVMLSSGQKGGELVFKREGIGNASVLVSHWNSRNDGQGLLYQPRQGDMLMYYNTHPNGKPDVQAACGHCPLAFGQQHILTQLFYDKPVKEASSH